MDNEPIRIHKFKGKVAITDRLRPIPSTDIFKRLIEQIEKTRNQ